MARKQSLGFLRDLFVHLIRAICKYGRRKHISSRSGWHHSPANCTGNEEVKEELKIVMGC